MAVVQVQAPRESVKRRQEDAPPDGGWGWVIVVAGHFSLLLSLGSLTAFGPFIVRLKEYYDSGAGLIGGISGAAVFVTLWMGPVSSLMTTRFGFRPVVMTGGVIATLGLVLSSLATEIYQLYLTYSLISGIGYGMVLTPSMAFFSRYFRKRYATANGIGFAGIAVAWIVLPTLFQKLIDSFGWKGAMMVVAGITANICVFAALLRPPPQKPVTVQPDAKTNLPRDSSIQVRSDAVPPSDHEKDLKTTGRCQTALLKLVDVELFRNPLFLIMILNNLLVGLGFYPSVLFLVARAVAYGIPDPLPTALMTVWGVFSVIGRAVHGFFVDRGIITATQGFCGGLLVCSMVNIISFPVQNFVGLALLYGLFGISNGVFHPLATVVLKDFLGVEKLPAALGLCNIFLGLGGLLGSPIAGWIFDSTGDYNFCFVYSGAMLFAAGSLMVFVPCIKRRQVRKLRTFEVVYL